MARGIVAGAVVENQLIRLATSVGLSINSHIDRQRIGRRMALELVAVEVSTARSIQAVPSARIALNHVALRGAVQRYPHLFGEVPRVGTRVELLSLRTGYTRFLGAEGAEEWHVSMANEDVSTDAEGWSTPGGAGSLRSDHRSPGQPQAHP